MKTNTYTCGVRHHFDGGTKTLANEVSESSWRGSRRWNFTNRVRCVVVAAAILGLRTYALHAGTPPPVSVVHTSTGEILGGVAIGPDDAVYFSTLGTATTKPRVTRLNANGTFAWAWQAPVVGNAHNVYAIPVLSDSYSVIYFGTDAGTYYCLNTSDGSLFWSYAIDVTTPCRAGTSFPPGATVKIRSGGAHNGSLNRPLVYFQGNNGYLYAIKEDTGTKWWCAYTGNIGGPPAPTWHPEPFSSTPVMARMGPFMSGPRLTIQ